MIELTAGQLARSPSYSLPGGFKDDPAWTQCKIIHKGLWVPLCLERTNLRLQLRDLCAQGLDFFNRVMQRQRRIHLDDVIIKS